MDYGGKIGDFSNPWRLYSVAQVEELKILGMVMDGTIESFAIPAASTSTFDTTSVILWVPIYDSILMPVARKFIGKEKGLSKLQRWELGCSSPYLP